MHLFTSFILKKRCGQLGFEPTLSGCMWCPVYWRLYTQGYHDTQYKVLEYKHNRGSIGINRFRKFPKMDMKLRFYSMSLEVGRIEKITYFLFKLFSNSFSTIHKKVFCCLKWDMRVLFYFSIINYVILPNNTKK